MDQAHHKMRRLVRTPSEHQAVPLRRQSTSHFLGADLVRRQDAGQVTSDECRGGALYTAPLQGAVVDSAQMLKIEWNKACLLDQGNIDIYVVTSAGVKPLAAYKGIPSDRGFYQAQLHPYWWGGTASANLTLNIVKSGNEVWDSPNPVGPQWVATYAVPGPGQPVPDYADGSTSKADQIVSYFFAGGGLTPGGKAAAIICPLVVVLCGIGLYLRKHHINRFNKTADWANNMDKRMSRISVDWDRGGDGSKGPMPGTRPASFYPRPSQDPSVMGHRNRASQYKPDEQEMDEIDPEIRDAYGGLAGLGASASSLGHGLGAGGDHSGSRISFAASGAGDRRSRISFAPPRESNDGQSSGVNRHRASASIPRVGQNNWRRSVGGSSAFRDSVADSDVPEVPKLALNLRSSPLAGGSHEPDDLLMSPTQHDGPRALANSDVDLMRPSFDSFGTNASGPSPAAGFMNRQTMDSTLSHGYFSANGAGVGAGVGTGGGGLGRLGMGTPGENENSDAYAVSTGAHLPYTSSSPPPQLPSMPGLGSSASGFGSQVRTGMAPPANTSSPDDAMRAYAAARAAGTVGAGVGAGGAGVGAGVGSGAGTGPGGMRTLFAGGLDDDSAHRASPSMGGSMGGSSLNEDDVVGYNEAAAAGH